jgi:RNA ligase (TIGR02306 family)
MRKLASVQRILGLHPIQGADLIELATINGWQCVVKKGEFQVGDLGVYLEIDAVPPIDGPHRELFSFLWKGQAGPSPSLRIRTMRLRGALSQGLMLSIGSFPGLTLTPEWRAVGTNPDGLDVTGLLGVHKYEPPPPDGMGDYAGPFAADIPKTDEQRIQSMPELLEELRGLPYCITEKCDGTSATMTMGEDGAFHVYGRNHEIAESDNIFWRAARAHNIADVMRLYPRFALQGEVVGPGIQKNRLGLKRVELRAFNLFHKGDGQSLGQDKLLWLCSVAGIPWARVIERGDSFQHTQESLLGLAEGKYEGTQNEREGIVIRPLFPQHSQRLGGTLSFKAISNTFLLKGGD